ncbi:MAG: tig [Solirubrobacterales bacterium]|nr:tig [Solirubrobacterales bacterium]
MQTSVTELPESRVRVEAEVPTKEVERSLEQAAKALGKDMKMPGFRAGKVPTPVVIKRFGREAVLDQAVRGSLGKWYVEALEDARIHPVGDPDLDLSDLPEPGEPLKFTFEIGVRPTAKLGKYKGLEVARREGEPEQADIDAELEQLRERSARLETVEEPAAQGDFVVMDYVGSIDGENFEGGEGRDQMVELGTGRLIPGFEEQLEGAAAGEDRTVSLSFPDDYGAEHLQGKAAEFAVTVKEIKRKRLPELDDEFALEAGGFDSIDELREDIASKLREADQSKAEAEYREGVLDAVAANAKIEVPEALSRGRSAELFERMMHQLSHQGINKEMYLQISGKDEEEIIAEALPDAEQALRREAVLAAVIEAEKIEPADGDILDALQSTAAREDTTPEKLRDRLEKTGRLDDLKDDLAQRMAIDFLVEHAKPVAAAPVKEREKASEKA